MTNLSGNFRIFLFDLLSDLFIGISQRIFNTVICIEIVALDYPYTCILGKRDEKSTSRPKSGKTQSGIDQGIRKIRNRTS